MWHLAHSAVPTKFLREEADLVGHQAGEVTWSSVASETSVAEAFDELALDELAFELDAFALDAAGVLCAVR